VQAETLEAEMISDAIGSGAKRILDALVRAIARSSISPNAITFIGLLINIGCGVLYGYGNLFSAGLLLIFAALFDMLDGRVARLRREVTRFGAFFDSVLDRYSDIVVYLGIMIYYARDTVAHSTVLVALTGFALVGSVLVSYSRARAESLNIASHWTVVHRIYHTWRELREPDRLRVEEAQHQREDSPAGENLVGVDYSVQS
jgi:phosphatidylglycerophosphate synthase